MGLVGTRSVTIPSSAGAFLCPECGGTEYRVQRVRRFMTLTAMPIVPLDLLGEYIECQLCKATYDPAVLHIDLDQNHPNIEATFNEAMKRVMVLMMLADKRIEESEIQAIIDIFQKITGRKIGRDEIKREILIAKSQDEQLDTYLSGLLGRLNDDGKLLVIRAAYFVANADGHFDTSEMELLQNIGTKLELPSEIVADLIESIQPTM